MKVHFLMHVICLGTLLNGLAIADDSQPDVLLDKVLIPSGILTERLLIPKGISKIGTVDLSKGESLSLEGEMPGADILHPPPAIKGSDVAPRVDALSMGLFRVVNDRETPALNQGKDLAGGQGTSPCKTSNDAAQLFATKYKSKLSSVALVIEKADGRYVHRGTAVLIAPNLMATAGHVLTALGVNSDNNAISKKDVFVVFNVHLGKFPHGIDVNYDPTSDPEAVRISIGERAISHDTIDVGLFRIPHQANRMGNELYTGGISNNSELVLAGIPDAPRNEDATDPEGYSRVFKICNLPNSIDLEHPENLPVVTRVGTGRYVGNHSIGSFRFNINAVTGNSGSPIFLPESGQVVGINYGTVLSYPASVKVRYNLAASAQIVSDLAAQFARYSMAAP